MLARSSPAAPLRVLDARPTRVGPLAATRYRLHRPHVVTGDDGLDRALSTFGAVVVPPADGRAEAPVVTLLNGITQPMARGFPVARALAEAGAAVAMVDTPFAGGRRITAGRRGADLVALAQRGVPLDVPTVRALFDGVAADLPAVFAFVEAEHRVGPRRALVGVSFGGLLSSLAFARDGLGGRLLSAIGHPDLAAMSRGLVDTFARFAGLPPALVSGGLRLGAVADAAARRYGGEPAVGALRFARLLATLGRGGGRVDGLDPLGFAGLVGPDRAAHFLAGQHDPVAPPEAVGRSASSFASSTVEVVPGLGHGWFPGGAPGASFEERLGAWAVGRLTDWAAE